MKQTHPAVVILVQHADQSTGTKLKLVVHGRDKVNVYAVDVVRTTRGKRTTSGTTRGAVGYTAIPITTARFVGFDAQRLGNICSTDGWDDTIRCLGSSMVSKGIRVVFCKAGVLDWRDANGLLAVYFLLLPHSEHLGHWSQAQTRCREPGLADGRARAHKGLRSSKAILLIVSFASLVVRPPEAEEEEHDEPRDDAKGKENTNG